MNTALDRGDDGKDKIHLPEAGPPRPLPKEKVQASESHNNRKSVPKHLEEEATFKDVVEAWCEEENLVLIPLREAHENGLPLFRITASATGKGGILVYLKGDSVWVQKRGDKSTWTQAGLGQDLVDRAEKR